MKRMNDYNKNDDDCDKGNDDKVVGNMDDYESILFLENCVITTHSLTRCMANRSAMSTWPDNVSLRTIHSKI